MPKKTLDAQMLFDPFFLKIIGISLTASVIALGAPLWFDILSKFMQVRGTGAKPDRTALN